MILFPCSPLATNRIDPDFAHEGEIALQVGHRVGLYDHARIDEGDFAGAVTGLLPRPDDSEVVLRGWMMPADHYEGLYKSLLTKGLNLMVDPASYAEAHYLPLAYRYLEGETPRSVWNESRDSGEAWNLYQELSGKPALLKDWVKSAKHRWTEACYLPAHCPRGRFEEIHGAFLRERGHLFNRGTVIREFVSLASQGADLKGFPLVEEYRLFFWKKRLLSAPTITGSSSPLGELERWIRLAGRFSSPFMSLDVARLEKGGWIVVETGDGGVSGLPLTVDTESFYAGMR